MYEVIKTFEISASHSLDLDYPSKCTALHGHNWRITVHLRAEKLNRAGMVMDFSEIKEKVSARLDHKILNEAVPFNPTAENLAEYICGLLVPFCYKVEVRESENNTAVYYKEQLP